MVLDLAAEKQASVVTDLFQSYHAELYAYLCRLLRNRDSAQDLLQDVFVQALRAGSSLRQVQNPRAWLYRIATNLAINAIKRQNRFSWLPWRAAPLASTSFGDPGTQIGTRSAVEQALVALPVEYRAVLLLYEKDGFSVAEVAEAVGLSQGAVKMRLCRARELFRQAYGGEEE